MTARPSQSADLANRRSSVFEEAIWKRKNETAPKRKELK